MNNLRPQDERGSFFIFRPCQRDGFITRVALSRERLGDGREILSIGVQDPSRSEFDLDRDGALELAMFLLGFVQQSLAEPPRAAEPK